MYPRQTQDKLHQYEGGYLMPLAAFIIVIMGALATTLSRLSQQTDLSVVQEAVSAQAFYAAESGAQTAMNRLFYFADVSRGSVTGRCNTINGDTVNFSVSGLSNCATLVSCSVSTDPGNTTSYYSIRSVGSCGTGNVSAQRIIDVSAYISDGV